ncbi:hypothetical protein Golob_026433 [Gossypium lobatum]|uniref:Uncharacterized protein n=1 Tax=Gossypium lobatum TaxID=34289 RepID=A0A7J8LVB7_9ROSI|nr:hypothetical protein [Gossypium lobatum]
MILVHFLHIYSPYFDVTYGISCNSCCFIRFHLLAEFDDSRRSYRTLLAGHNELKGSLHSMLFLENGVTCCRHIKVANSWEPKMYFKVNLKRDLIIVLSQPYPLQMASL